MIIRIIYGTIYSLLMMALTGIPQTALAIVSCQDTINPNTTIRYSDALVSFKEYNGKTYAIAKSAATGGASELETFFDFSADITRAYAMTGDATGSLKNLLSLGQYGAATPVKIDSADTEKFILTQFGKYLGTAASPQSTYVDAWKEFGTGGFTAFDGSALPYTNWATAVYSGQEPQSVVMGADGKWTSGLDGVRSAQIVQFDGKLDCAVSVTPPLPGSITPPSPPPASSAGPDLTKPVCGQDLNSNGYAADPGEVANCTTTPQGEFCPVGSVNCVETYSAPVCPSGSVLNTVRDMCQADAAVSCGTGYSYDVSIDKCVETVPCPDNGTFNPVTDQCEKLVLNQCPSGYTYDTTLDVCRMSAGCPGGTLNQIKDRCETPPAWNCPSGFTYNAVSLRCEVSPYCPPGTAYNAARDRCEAALGSCPAGYSYNAVLDTCTASVNCPSGGSLNGISDKCELTSSIACPSGTTYDASTGKCENAPSCASPGTYNAAFDICLTPSTGASCPTGYTYNSSYGACISTPSCVGGTYSNANNRCEANPSYSCSDAGYTYNAAYGRCEKTPVCAQGTYNATYNICLQSITPTCPFGYSYNSSRGRCEKAPECSAGTTYNVVTNKCDSITSAYQQQVLSCSPTSFLCTPSANSCCNVNISCPDGPQGRVAVNANYCCLGSDSLSIQSPSDLLNRQELTSTGFALSALQCDSTGYCNYYFMDRFCNDGSPASDWGLAGAFTMSSTQMVCPSGNTLVNGSQCLSTSNPTCTNGSFDGSADVCWVNYTPSCPAGTTYDVTIGSCTVAPICSNGLLDSNRDICYRSANAACSSGYALSGSLCTATPFCATGGSLDGSIDFCKATAIWNCPSGYSYSATYGQCYQMANCGAGSLNGSLDVCQQSYSLTCPSGYTLNGTTCQTTPTCATGGSYNANLDLCDGGANVCASPLTLDPVADKCYQAASCFGGTLNSAKDLCEAVPSVNCGVFSWDGAAQVCYSPPVCNQGAYNATDNECRATVTRNCGTYGWSSTLAKCTQQIVCPKDSGFAMRNTVAYSPTLDKCTSDAQHTCPTGTTYNGLPLEKCEAVPVCTGDGIYNTTLHSCFLGMNTCPLGTQYNCMNNQGTMQCSPNQCFTAGASGTEQLTTMDESMMQNDGQRDQNGNCLDQLYVFNGKGSRCRPPGLTVGLINNCCDSDKVGSDDMGSNISMVANGIQTTYELGEVAYYGNALATGAAQIASITTSASGAVTGMTVVTASGSTATLSGATATGAYGALASGATGAEAVTAGVTEYVGALLNPATIAVAVVVMVVMKVLFGNGCDQGDIQTGMQAASKGCHYIGDYCEKKWPLVGCVQKAKGYCCFNTKMARIIHEQGRPQLVSFGADGGWGAPSAPNCRGFTPDEFQYLDFSRIDLSEYFGDIQQDLSTKIQGAQTTIQNKVQQHFQATTGGI